MDDGSSEAPEIEPHWKHPPQKEGRKKRETFQDRAGRGLPRPPPRDRPMAWVWGTGVQMKAAMGEAAGAGGGQDVAGSRAISV